MKIAISKHGPYLVSGDYTLMEETIVQKVTLVREKTHDYQVKGTVALCRCGHSQTKPFCDGTHEKIHFQGQTTASKAPYVERSQVEEGDALSLLDDNRCAFARFCHRQHGEVWSLTEASSNPQFAKEAIEGATACPSGRLTALVNNQLVEDVYPPEISVVQDPLEGCSAGLFIRGDSELIDEENHAYEKRNRMSLCRCGKSRNKPFCDATHVSIGFADNRLRD